MSIRLSPTVSDGVSCLRQPSTGSLTDFWAWEEFDPLISGTKCSKRGCGANGAVLEKKSEISKKFPLFRARSARKGVAALEYAYDIVMPQSNRGCAPPVSERNSVSVFP